LEKEEAATVANSKGVNNDWTTNKGCHFFLLDSAAFVEKGKKKQKKEQGRGEEQATAMGVPCAACTSKE